LTETPILDFINESSDKEVRVAFLSEIIRRRLISEMMNNGMGVSSPRESKELDRICKRAAKYILKKGKGIESEEEMHRFLEAESDQIVKESLNPTG
jgi:hypothetical protein